MSQNLAELLELLVEDFYGEVASSVFTVLARHGRLSVPGLIQYSGLPLRILKAGLVTLIQQHLAFHHVGSDGLTYYEVNLDSAYMLARSGKVLCMFKERFGQAGEEVARTLMSEGQATLTDLAAAYGVKEEEEEHDLPSVNGDSLTNGINGHSNERHSDGRQIHSFNQLQRLLERMKKKGYVVAVTTKSFISPADLESDAGLLARSNLPVAKAPNGKKQREEYSKAVNALKRRWRDSEAEERMSEDEADQPPTKKTKTNGLTNGVNGNHSYDQRTKQKDPTVLKINYAKVNVVLRLHCLTDLAARYVGDTSSKVYQALLETMAEHQPRCFEDILSTGAGHDSDADDDLDDRLFNPTITAMDLLDKIPRDFDVSRGIAAGARPLANGINGAHETDAGGEEDDQSTTLISRRDDDDRHKLQQIARHLDILANSTIKFCRRVGSTGGGQYKVDFQHLCTKLQQVDIEDTVTSRFGNEASRIIRILDAKGKLDDRQLGVLSLQRVRDVKVLLLELQTAGFLDLQEVPRDAARAPQRTIYLYFYDRDRVRRKMLDDTYKIMARLLQRSKVERERVRLVIEKAERTDVQGNEEKYLSTAELQELRAWQVKEDRLLLALSRCDDIVAVLRDFLPDGEWV